MDPGQKNELIAIFSAHDQLMFKDFIISIPHDKQADIP